MVTEITAVLGMETIVTKEVTRTRLDTTAIVTGEVETIVVLVKRNSESVM